MGKCEHGLRAKDRCLVCISPKHGDVHPFEDALERAYWEFDAMRKGYPPRDYAIAERDAFKAAVRVLLAGLRHD